jgi:tetratricopeptide (TPR) repeat protein
VLYTPTTPGAGIMAGRFELLGECGSGGMGTVFRARDLANGAVVALKLLQGSELAQAERFDREARLLAQLRHPGIVRHVAHGVTPDGQHWIAMEWLAGESLEQRLAEGRGPSLQECLTLVRRAAEALGFAHRLGVVHRDVKPSNLFLAAGAEGEVILKVLDFGIARSAQLGDHFTRTGVLLGTPAYMSPEQARGDATIDARADVFALGAVLFECVTARRAFDGDNPAAVLAKILFEDPPRAGELRRDVPAPLDDLIARMLAKDASQRPANGGDVARELDYLGPLDGSRISPWSGALPALTTGEQRLVSAVVTRPGPPATAAGADGGADADKGAGAAGLAAVEWGPVDVTAAMLRLPLGELRAAVEPHEARLEMLADGTVVALLAGHGIPREQAARAARSALAMRSLLPGAAMVLATGPAVLGRRLPVGDVIERAVAALQGASGAGIVLDEVSADLLEAQFDLGGGPGARELRGEREAAAPGTRTLLGRPTPFVGRDRELQLLQATLRDCVRDGEARAVIVSAVAGLGKSRLRHEFLAWVTSAGGPGAERAGGAAGAGPDAGPGAAPGVGAAGTPAGTIEVLQARGDSLSAGSAFGLLARALRSSAGILVGEPARTQRQKLAARVSRHVPAEDAIRVTAFLGELAGVPFPEDECAALRPARTDARLMGDQMRAAWESFLEAECAAQPVLLVLEDMHWGDLPTVQLVDGALRHLSDRPFMVLALARPDVFERFPRLWEERGATDLKLPRLGKRASERLVREVLGDAVQPAVAARMVEQADGHVLYLEELIRGAAAGRPDGLPMSLLAMVQARLDELDAEARRVLRAASVFGQVFWEGGVAALVGGRRRRELVHEVLEDLVRRELIMPRGPAVFPDEREYAFRHALVREATYATLTTSDRVLGHRLAGEWLHRLGEPDAVMLAEHFELGRERARSAALYRRAAAEALGGNDLEAAIARAERGVACRAEGETLGALRLLQAQAHRWKGAMNEATEQARAATELLPAGGRPWYDAICELLLARGRQRDAESLVTLTVRLEETPPLDVEAARARVEALCAAATVLAYAGQRELATTGLRLAEEALAALSESDPRLEARVHVARAAGLVLAGLLGDALDEHEAAAARFEAAGDVRNSCLQCCHVGELLVRLGQHERAEAVLCEVLAVAERMRLAFVVAQTRHALGIALARQRRLPEARGMLERAVQWLGTSGDLTLQAGARLRLAEVLLLSGALAEAEHESAAASEAAARFAPLRPLALAMLARVLLARGRAEVAAHTASAEAADGAGAVGCGAGDPGLADGRAMLALVHAEALHQTGDPVAARRVIRAARDRLLERAALIPEATLRDAFLDAVPENARTMALVRVWRA